MRKIINIYGTSLTRIGSTLLLATALVISTFGYSIQTTASSTRSDPYIPNTPDPVNGSTDVPITALLSWAGGDPDPDDNVTYDVYFGVVNPPDMMVNNQSATSYDPGIMAYLTTYFWQIVAWDNDSNYAVGPIWNFTTGANHPPNIPDFPEPANGSTNVPVQTNLSWIGGDPDNNPVTYDLYFGITTTPPEIAGNLTNTTYEGLPTLAYNTTYYWRIVATDNHSANTTGPIWLFTTEVATGIWVTITRPLNNSFYFQGQRHNLSGRTIIYGSINITADATADAGIARVDFYIDGKIKGNDTTAPYYYVWKPFLQINGLSLRHTIKVVAVDTNGRNASAEINVTKWRFHILPVAVVGAAVLSSAVTHTKMKGLVFHIREKGRGYSFIALHMTYHTIGPLMNERGVIKMKRVVIRILIGPAMIYRIGPCHMFAYVSLTFLGRVPTMTNPLKELFSHSTSPLHKTGLKK